MAWNPFGQRKPKAVSDEQKIAFADMIAEMLQIQLIMVGEKAMDSRAGGPKPGAMGYLYGYVDAVLRSRGLDMRDPELGIPITFQVIRRLWPGKEREYTDFLAGHLSDPIVCAGIMHGGQQYTDWFKSENSDDVPMGLARYIIAEV